MNSHKFKIEKPEHIKKAAVILAGIDLSSPWMLDLRPYKRNRSVEQNALYRKWVRIMAAELGFEEEDLHEEFKKRYVIPILERDDPDFAENINLLRELFMEGKKAESEKLAAYMRRLVSTTNLNTKQFSEMMDQVNAYAMNVGIVLPQPEEKGDQ